MSTHRRENARQMAWKLAPRLALLCLMVMLVDWLMPPSKEESEPPPSLVPSAPSAPTIPANVDGPLPSSSLTGDAPIDAGGADAAVASEPELPPEEAMPDRRTARQILAGTLPYPSRRITWHLSRGKALSRLDVLCQAGEGSRKMLGMVLNGEEYEEARWQPLIRTTYVGVSSGKELEYHFTMARAPASFGKCRVLPRDLLLTCRPDKVSVRPAFTKLFSGDFIPGKEKVVAFWWKPNEQTSVAVLSCEANAGPKSDEDQYPQRLTSLAPLAFVSGKAGTPPIEWVFQNDDGLQEATYRWMPAR